MVNSTEEERMRKVVVVGAANVARLATKKEAPMIERKMGDLFEELLENILSRVPFKLLTTMKCVSKEWCRLISRHQSSLLRLASSGLIDMQTGNCGKSKTPVKLFEVKDQHGELKYFENGALSSTLDGDIVPLCRLNGLLLCCHQCMYCTSPFLYDLVLEQLVSLPSPAEFRRATLNEFSPFHPFGIGLAVDSIPNHHFRNFKVVCFHFDHDLNSIECMIFSTETREWRMCRPRLLNSSIVDDNLEHNEMPEILLFESVFHDGLIYWSVSGYFLTYNIQEDFFEIHNLPSKNQCGQYLQETFVDRVDDCFWVSKGFVHYCYSDKYGFYVWTRQKGKELHSDDEQDGLNSGWLLKHMVDLETLKTRHPEFFDKALKWQKPDRICFLKPCAFNEDFQILYLKLPGSLIVSYSFEHECLKQVILESM